MTGPDWDGSLKKYSWVISPGRNRLLPWVYGSTLGQALLSALKTYGKDRMRWGRIEFFYQGRPVDRTSMYVQIKAVAEAWDEKADETRARDERHMAELEQVEEALREHGALPRFNKPAIEDDPLSRLRLAPGQKHNKETEGDEMTGKIRWDRAESNTERYYTAERAGDAPQSWRGSFGSAIVQAVSFKQLVYRLKDYHHEVKDGLLLVEREPLRVTKLGAELAPSIVLEMWLSERTRWQEMNLTARSLPPKAQIPRRKYNGRLRGS